MAISTHSATETSWTPVALHSVIPGGMSGLFNTPEFVFDPQVAWDPYINRFLVAGVSLDNSLGTSHLFLAVSRSSDPTQGWDTTWFDVTLNGSVPTPFWCDYPQLGFDATAVYATCNMFTFSVNGSRPWSCSSIWLICSE